MPHPTLHLASASPRRADILKSLKLRFSVSSADIDETPQPGESAEDMVLRLARGKAKARVGRADIVLGADTAVVLDQQLFAKPASEQEAVAMLAALSGRIHTVLTGVAVATAAGLKTTASRSTVRFRDIDSAEARDYWHSGEPLGKAGGYAIQGLGGAFVADLRGSYSGVVGLPVFETVALLKSVGLDVLAGSHSGR